MVCTPDSDLGNALFSGALLIATKGRGDIGGKVITNYLEPGSSGKGNIAFSIFHSRIGIIYDEILPAAKAGIQQDRLAVAGFQHIQVYADMGIDEVLFVEGALPTGLNPD